MAATIPAKAFQVKKMSLLPKVAWISLLAAAALPSAPPQAAAQTAQVQRVSLLKSGAGTQIEIQTSRRVIPLTQVLTDPDRLVIDFSDAVASPQIHTINVNNAAVKQVRVGRVTDNPPITRVVIDLTSAQPFQLLPSGKSVIVKIGDGGSAGAPGTEIAKVAPVAKPEPPASPATVAAQPPVEQPAPSNVPVPKLSVRPAVSSPAVAAVPVASRSVPASPLRAAVLNTAPEPAPSISMTRVPISSSGRAEVRRVAVLKTSGATEIEIETSERITPEVQTVTGPDRLVIDFPQASPGPLLRALAVHQGEVKGVRVGLLSAKPPVTRIVLDLNSPQAYQLFPSTRSVIVKLGDAGNSGAAVAPAQPAAQPETRAPEAQPSAPPPPPKKVDVAMQDGKMSLTSDKASLAEVLNELRSQTGADIVIPPGAEREEVAVSLGPASPRDVISQLLNGSRYNFIIMGADGDANRVAKLILTPKTAGGVVPQVESDDPAAAMPDPVPVAQMQAAQRSSGPAPAVPPAIEEAQPQGDSNPPPDTSPQPGDPQAAPN